MFILTSNVQLVWKEICNLVNLVLRLFRITVSVKTASVWPIRVCVSFVSVTRYSVN